MLQLLAYIVPRLATGVTGALPPHSMRSLRHQNPQLAPYWKYSWILPMRSPSL